MSEGSVESFNWDELYYENEGVFQCCAGMASNGMKRIQDWFEDRFINEQSPPEVRGYLSKHNDWFRCMGSHTAYFISCLCSEGYLGNDAVRFLEIGPFTNGRRTSNCIPLVTYLHHWNQLRKDRDVYCAAIGAVERVRNLLSPSGSPLPEIPYLQTRLGESRRSGYTDFRTEYEQVLTMLGGERPNIIYGRETFVPDSHSYAELFESAGRLLAPGGILVAEGPSAGGGRRTGIYSTAMDYGELVGNKWCGGPLAYRKPNSPEFMNIVAREDPQIVELFPGDFTET